MKNKFLLFIGSLLFVVLFGCVKTSASVGSYTFGACYKDQTLTIGNCFAFNATNGSTTYSGYQFVAPVAWRVGSGSSYVYCGNITNYNNYGISSGISSTSNYVYSWTQTSRTPLLITGMPYFNNIADASAYSRGLAYNANNIIGGTVPTSYGFVNDVNAKINITSLKYLYEVEPFSILSDGSIGYELTTQFEFTPVINFNKLKGYIKFFVPDKNDSNFVSFINNNGHSMWFTDASIISGYFSNPLYNSYRYTNGFNYVELIVPFSITEPSVHVKTFEFLLENDYNMSQDILNELDSYYENDDMVEYVSSLFMRLSSFEIHQEGFDISTKKYTAYPSAYYYPDLLNYDGSIYKKMDFNVDVPYTGPTNLTENQFHNVGNANNYPTINDNINIQTSDRYTTAFKEYENTKQNVEIYINTLDNKLDDWYNNGDLNIDDKIADVYSLAKSVSHISLLLGAMFNSWFPSWLVGLIMFAVAFIPIMIIIKLIRG